MRKMHSEGQSDAIGCNQIQSDGQSDAIRWPIRCNHEAAARAAWRAAARQRRRGGDTVVRAAGAVAAVSSILRKHTGIECTDPLWHLQVREQAVTRWQTVVKDVVDAHQQYCWRHAGSGLVTRPRERRPLSGSGWGGAVACSRNVGAGVQRWANEPIACPLCAPACAID